jgi:hypothetical protein
MSRILSRRRPDVSLPAADFGDLPVSIEFKGSHFGRDVIL